MGKPVSPQLQHAIEIIESLSPDEQWQLLEVVRRRLLEHQHAKPVKEAAEARRTYQKAQGGPRMGTLHRTEAIVSGDGTLTIRGLPFRAGDQVQVIVSHLKREPTGTARYPLHGKPLRYVTPFESVAEEDWDALK
jgi:hypothetical protein